MDIYIDRRDCWRKLAELKEIWREDINELGREFKRDIEINTVLFLKAKLTNEIKRIEAG